jgi:hypothetical protein
MCLLFSKHGEIISGKKRQKWCAVSLTKEELVKKTKAEADNNMGDGDKINDKSETDNQGGEEEGREEERDPGVRGDPRRQDPNSKVL